MVKEEEKNIQIKMSFSYGATKYFICFVYLYNTTDEEYFSHLSYGTELIEY